MSPLALQLRARAGALAGRGPPAPRAARPAPALLLTRQQAQPPAGCCPSASTSASSRRHRAAAAAAAAGSSSEQQAPAPEEDGGGLLPEEDYEVPGSYFDALNSNTKLGKAVKGAVQELEVLGELELEVLQECDGLLKQLGMKGSLFGAGDNPLARLQAELAQQEQQQQQQEQAEQQPGGS